MDNYTLRCMEIIKKYYPMISVDSNILGIGMGFKTINNITTNIPCLKVYVSDKISKNSISKNKIIPKVFNGAITDIVAVGESKDYCNVAMQNYNITPNAVLTVPARGGELIYNKSAKGPVGTLSCAVSEQECEGDSIYILSTSRIITGNNTGKIGSFIFQKSGTIPNAKEKIIASQDSKWDLKLVPKGTSASKDPTLINTSDAAIVYVESTKVGNSSNSALKDESQLIISSGMFDKKQIIFPKDLDSVLKEKSEIYMLSKYSGRRSGNIETILFSGMITVEDKIAYFAKQFLINMPGVTAYDYGALVFAKDDKVKKNHVVLGMIIGHCGEINKGKVIVTPIKIVLSKVNKYIYYYKDEIPIG